MGSGDPNSGPGVGMSDTLSTGSSLLPLEMAIFKTEVRVANLGLVLSA